VRRGSCIGVYPDVLSSRLSGWPDTILEWSDGINADIKTV